MILLIPDKPLAVLATTVVGVAVATTADDAVGGMVSPLPETVGMETVVMGMVVMGMVVVMEDDSAWVERGLLLNWAGLEVIVISPGPPPSTDVEGDIIRLLATPLDKDSASRLVAALCCPVSV